MTNTGTCARDGGASRAEAKRQRTTSRMESLLEQELCALTRYFYPFASPHRFPTRSNSSRTSARIYFRRITDASTARCLIGAVTGEVWPSTEISGKTTRVFGNSAYVFCNPSSSLPALQLRSENPLRTPSYARGSENRRYEIFSIGGTQLILPGRVENRLHSGPYRKRTSEAYQI